MSNSSNVNVQDITDKWIELGTDMYEHNVMYEYKLTNLEKRININEQTGLVAAWSKNNSSKYNNKREDKEREFIKCLKIDNKNKHLVVDCYDVLSNESELIYILRSDLYLIKFIKIENKDNNTTIKDVFFLGKEKVCVIMSNNKEETILRICDAFMDKEHENYIIKNKYVGSKTIGESTIIILNDKNDLYKFDLDSYPHLEFINNSNKECSGFDVFVDCFYKLNVLAVLEHNEICLISKNRVHTKKELTQIKSLKISPNRKMVVVVLSTNVIKVFDIEFDKIFLSFDSTDLFEPNNCLVDVYWCSNDIVVLNLANKLILLSAFGEHSIINDYNNDGIIDIVTKCDSALIYSNKGVHILRKVEECVLNVFQIGSTSLSSFLFNNNNKYLNNINLIINNEDSKNIEIINEYSCFTQLASFVKSYVTTTSNSNHYKDTVVRLRVLNTLRNHLKIPLTYYQIMKHYDEMEITKTIIKSGVNNYFDAFLIAEYLNFQDSCFDYILQHFLVYKLSNKNDQQILPVIHKYYSNKEVSFQKLSKTSLEYGFKDLALKLLSFEKCKYQTLPILIKMKEYRKVVDALSTVNNTDYQRLMLLNIQSNMSISSFFMLISTNEQCYNSYKNMLIEQGKNNQLKDLLYQKNDVFGQLKHEFKIAFLSKDCTKIQLNAVKIDTTVTQFSSISPIIKKINSQHKKITQIQAKLNKETTGLSLIETIKYLILEQKNYDYSINLYKQFKIDKKQFVTTIVQASIISNQVDQIKNVSLKLDLFNSKNNDYYSLKISTLLISSNYHNTTANIDTLNYYILKCSNDHNRLTLYLKSSQFKSALDIAVQYKSVPKLRQIYVSCGNNNTELKQIIDGYIYKFSTTN